MEKSNTPNKSSSKRNNYLLSGILVIIYIATALLIAVATKTLMGSSKEQNISITDNAGDEAFYNAKYDNAINEYNTLQEKDTWPKWNVKCAQVYSIQANYTKSNEILQKAYESRNKIVDVKNKQVSYSEEDDRKLGNDIVLTYLLNGEDKKSYEYGQYFLSKYPDDKNLIKTMLAVYLSNGKTDLAKELVGTYEVDEDDAYDLAIYSHMQFLIGDYTNGLSSLVKAWNVDSDEIKIFMVLDDLSNSDESLLMQNINKQQEKNKNEKAYDAFLAKIYSKEAKNYDKSLSIINKLTEDEAESVNISLVKENIYRNTDKADDADEILDSICDQYDESTFTGCYVRTIRDINKGNLTKALNYAKKSININSNYVDVYCDLIPEIKDENKKSIAEAEPYYRTALNKEPYNITVYKKTANYYKDILKDSTKALYYFEAASKINKNDPEIYYELALIQNTNKRTDEAITYLKKSLAIDSKNEKYYRALGSIYMDKKNYESAIKAIRNAYSINKDDILTLNNAACYYVTAENDLDRAFTNIKAAYDGIDDKISESDKKIISDNYNRIKSAHDSKKNSKSEYKATELKLFY